MVNEFLTSDNVETLHRIGYTGDVNKILARVKQEAVELQGKEKEFEKARMDNDGNRDIDAEFYSVAFICEQIYGLPHRPNNNAAIGVFNDEPTND
ncbi:MAG: hypothetical protein LBD87_02350 [Prevotellaceae bacterium]|nr:hypothetical protein [Prevotellaceae bacterium]